MTTTRCPELTETNPHGITYEIALRSIQRSQYNTELKHELKVQIWQDMHPNTLHRQAEEEAFRFEQGKTTGSAAIYDLVTWSFRNLHDIRGVCQISVMRPPWMHESDENWQLIRSRVRQFNAILTAERNLRAKLKGR